MINRKIIYVIVLTLLLSLMAGCGQSLKTVQSDNPNETNVGTEEQLKDTVVLDLLFDISTLDPHYSAATYNERVYTNIYDTLIRVDKSGEFVPWLAENWEISEDKLTYTFNLKKGVKFQNGEELKASDVVYTIKRAKESPYMASQTEQIKDIVAIDEYTVQIILKKPCAPFLLIISFQNILNEKAVIKAGEDYGENPIGTGPYKFVRHDIGQRVVLESFEDYFQGSAPIKNVEFKIIGEATTAMIALETGEIDFTFNVPMIARKSIINNPKFMTHEVETVHLNYMIMNNEAEPFNNKLVRQAMNYAINKEAVIQIAAEGIGEKAKSILNKFTFGYSENIKGYAYDPEKAKQLLAEAGYTDGFETSIISIGGATQKIVEVVQENLSNIGVTAKIEMLEANAGIQDIKSGNYEMSYMGMTLLQDADDHSLCYHSTGDFNVSRYNNPRVDELFDEARTILDRSERSERYEELLQILEDDAVVVPLYFTTRVYASNKDLKIGHIDAMEVVRIADMSWK